MSINIGQFLWDVMVVVFCLALLTGVGRINQTLDYILAEIRRANR